MSITDFANVVAQSFSQATEIVLMRDTLSPGQFEHAYRSLRELLQQYDRCEKHWNSLPHEPATFGQYQRAGDNALHVGMLFSKSVYNSLEVSKVNSLGMPKIDDLKPSQWKKWTKAATKEIGTVTLDLSAWSMSAFRRDTELILRKMASEVAMNKEPDDKPITMKAITELCVGRMNRVGVEVAGSESTVRGWKCKAKDFPQAMTWSTVRKWLNENKDFDIGPPPTEC